MASCHYDQYLAVLLLVGTLCSCTSASPTAEPVPEAEPEAMRSARYNDPDFVVIQEDVIADGTNATQKVIRVNPLDLPAIEDDPNGSMDSTLFKIQTLLPANRNYVNSKRMRKARPLQPLEGDDANSPILRPKHPKPHKLLPKKKHLHFLYNQAGIDGREVGKHMRVHVAPGAYPVYYVVSKTNGRFGKFPIKGFRTPTDFMKYLLKAKVESTTSAQQMHR